MSITMKLKDQLKVGQVLNNPLRGTSEIMSVDDTKVVYKRGNSNITLKFEDIEDVVIKFSGGVCSTSQMKLYKPQAFSSKHNGHSCNCTFCFMVLKEIGHIDQIHGGGRRSNPYYVIL
ncbi:hypothetical protein EZV73_10085 [Acidaminobacter sp. JC074]|uniref:hypothetical protein n=1 Tax=Acidaminobacter sp. JC074 TaxID=2530199 RepID=UPI001F0CE54B|nr:hypothetical protein [Acidaminobacter sp. JC074]MCH4887924.1 hypothetical protein [Acidaminobacter sp. JC074]